MTAPIAPSIAVPPQSPLGKAQALYQQMERKRDRHLPRWREVEEYVVPYASDVDQRGHAREYSATNILDDTILFCRNTLASGLYWGMTNPARQWRQWTITDPDLTEDMAVKDWLHVVNQRAMTVLGRSNFYRVMAWVYTEWPSFGTSVVLIEEDEQDIFRYVPLPIGSYVLADDAKGNPVALGRRIPMTVRQLVERFATRLDANGRKAVDMAKLTVGTKGMVENGNWEENVWVYHLICPNDAYDPTSDLPKDYAFASYYWEEGASQGNPPGDFLAKEGYREWPAMVFRWETVAGDPWGTDSPGILTLPSNKSSQQMESDKLMGVEKLVKPPIVVPPELQVASLLPAAKNAVATRQGQFIGALHETAPVAIQVMNETQAEYRERMMALWFTRLMLSFTANVDVRGGERPTAREVEEVSQEKYLVLGRILEAAGETFKVGSEREFAIMQRRGLLPPIPPALDGQPLTIEYTSMLAVAQKSVGVGDLKSFGIWIAEMARATGKPGFLDKLDDEQFVDEVAMRSNIPPRAVRSDEAVARIRRERAQQEQAMQQMALAEQEAKTVKNLADAPVDTNNALGTLLNAGQATPL